MVSRIGVVLLVLMFICTASVFARQPSKEARFEHADRNDDGTVDQKEMKMEKKWGNKQRSKVNAPWGEKADANKDGIVDKNGAASWKSGQKERIDLNNDGVIDPKERGMSWKHSRIKVNKPIEAKYDADGNGWLEPEEVKQMLQDKHTIIKTKGKAKVDTEIEAQYDDNKDGVIDASEASDLKDDLKN
jgi:hypothetical protein